MATNSRTARKKQKSKPKKPIWKKIIKLIFIAVLVGIFAIGGLFIYFIATAPKIDPDKLDVPYAAQFYDQDGNEFANKGKENRIKIQYDDLPEELINAVVATEDSRFFEHKGIDLRRIAGAIKANFQRGFGAEGASTITQQVVEQMFLTPDKTIKLKVQEQWLALKLEREYSKEEILEMYLNKIFYGSNAYGVAKAAEVYFGKEDLHDLTLIESAMLAGLPQRPTAYNPFENPEFMQERVQTVLTLMVRHGKITQAEADEANGIDVSSVLTDKKPAKSPHDAFIEKVEDELSSKIDEGDIYSAGLKIYTTLDRDVQNHVEHLLTRSDENPISYPEELQAGMVVLDTESGQIRAVGGGVDREDGNYNYAFDANRAPGSVFKPIMAYAPAIEYKQYSTYHQLNDDAPYDLGESAVRNWNRQYQGWMTMRNALTQSLNVPTLKLFEDVGIDKGKEFAEGIGLNFKEDSVDIQTAIGGNKASTTPLELAGAYSAFGNEGIYTEPYSVTKVEYPDGSVVEFKPESEVAMSDYTAYMVTDMLKSVIDGGTGTTANIPGLPVAGKTGTTNIPDTDDVNNAWFSGYTTDYTIAVWTGYNENERKMENTKLSQDLFRETMQEISKDMDTADFTKPDSVVEVAVEKGSNPATLPSDHTPSDNIITELFVKGTEPTSVSEKFDELDPVKDLSGSYNEDKQEIDVTWDYADKEDISFEVSYKVDDGEMKELSTTDDTKMTIESIDDGSTYTIQVVAIDKKADMKSEPATTTVEITEEEIPGIQDLQAEYDEAGNSILTSWSYEEAGASFEVEVNGNKQTVDSKSIEISNVSQGTTYDIKVTPIIDDKRGDSKTTSISIDEPEEEETVPDEEESPPEENSNEEPPDQQPEDNTEDEPSTDEQNKAEEENEENKNNEDNGEDEEADNSEEDSQQMNQNEQQE